MIAAARRKFGNAVRCYRRPLSRAFQAVRDAGFAVDRLVEPMPDPAAEAVDPKWTAKPRFRYFRAVSPSWPSPRSG
jgi:hypothetical protein